MRALGIDIGTTNIKVAVVHAEPASPTMAPLGEASTSPSTTAHLSIEALTSAPTPATAKSLVQTGLAAIRTLLAQLPDLAAEPIQSIGIASMAETGVPLDAARRGLCPLISWSDTRAEAEGAELADLAPELFRITGVRPGPKPPLAKWMHLSRREPALWQAMSAWAGAADLIACALTDNLATDHTLAGRTGAWDLWHGGYRPELLHLAGLTADRLPPVLPPGQPAGHTRPELGLGSIPVFIAGHDHAVGAHVAGVRDPGQLADSLGTAEAIYGIVGQAPAQMAHIAAAGMSLVRTVAGDRLALVAGHPSAGGAIAAASRLLGAKTLTRAEEELRQRWLHDRAAAPADLPIVLPYLRGRQSPEPDPAIGAGVLGIGPETSAVEIYDGLLTALCLQARWMVEEQTRLGVPEPSVLRVLGGPTRNYAWMARKAAASPWPIEVVPEPETVVLGAAGLALERSGRCTRALVPSHPVAVPHDPRHDAALTQFIARATRPPHPPT